MSAAPLTAWSAGRAGGFGALETDDDDAVVELLALMEMV
jgi:hypothetical protein